MDGILKEWEFEICWIVAGIILVLAGLGLLD